MSGKVNKTDWIFPDHLCLLVKDMKESLKFYHEILELPFEWTGIDGAGGSKENPRKMSLKGLELWNEKTSPLKSKYERSPYLHFGFRCEPGNIERIVAELKARGVKFTTEVKEIRYEKLGIPLGLKFVFFEDPSGIPLEIVEWYQL